MGHVFADPADRLRLDEPDLFARTFPMDLRPQAHEIIRTWLFSTIVRSHYEHGTIPWRHAAISGWILDPDRKKMSKSQGNIVAPGDLIEEHGADAVRYWAGTARPGTDTAFDPGQMKIGRRLSIKILNASKFVLGLGPAPAGAAGTEAVDQAMLADLMDLVDDATRAFEDYDYARALQRSEEFFWRFCDDYLELVKVRAYREGPGGLSARAALRAALSTVLRLFAPFLPYVTEEVWSWCRTPDGPLPGYTDGSIHRAVWPTASELRAVATDLPESDGAASVLGVATDVLRQIRKAKSDAKRSMRAKVAKVTVADTRARLAAFAASADDVRNAGNVIHLTTVEVPDDGAPRIEVLLDNPEAASSRA